jgi:hypothetical protein
MKPFYVVILQGPRIGFSFHVKSNALHHAKVTHAVGIVKLDSVSALKFDAQDTFKLRKKLLERNKEV